MKNQKKELIQLINDIKDGIKDGKSIDIHSVDLSQYDEDNTDDDDDENDDIITSLKKTTPRKKKFGRRRK